MVAITIKVPVFFRIYTIFLLLAAFFTISKNLYAEITKWNVVTTIAGQSGVKGTSGASADLNTNALAVNFAHPYGIVVDSNGDIIIGDAGDGATTTFGTISKIIAATGKVERVVAINHPIGMDVDSNDNVYVVHEGDDYGVNAGTTVSVLRQDTLAVAETDGGTFNGSGGTDGDAYDVAVTANSQSVYVAELFEDKVKIIGGGTFNPATYAGSWAAKADYVAAPPTTPGPLALNKNKTFPGAADKLLVGILDDTVYSYGAPAVPGAGVQIDGGASIIGISGIDVDSLGNKYISDISSAFYKVVSGTPSTLTNFSGPTLDSDNYLGNTKLSTTEEIFIDPNTGHLYFSNGDYNTFHKVDAGRVYVPDGETLTINENTTYTQMDGLAGSSLNLNGNDLTFGKNIGQYSSSTIETKGYDKDSLFNGDISGVGSNLIVNSDPAITLILGGANTYDGSTTITTGILALNADNTLPIGTDLTVDGTLDLSAWNQEVSSLAGAGTIKLNSGHLTVRSTSDTTFSGTIGGGPVTGSGSIRKYGGANKLTLSGAWSVYENIVVYEGTLEAGDNNALGGDSTSLAQFANGTTLETNGTYTFVNLFGLVNPDDSSDNSPGNVTFNINGVNTVEVSGIIFGPLGLTKSGVGTLKLSGSNSYTGDTNLNNGILEIANDNALEMFGTLIISNFTSPTLKFGLEGLYISSSIVTAAGLPFILDTNNYNGTLSGLISGGGGFVKTGTGTLTISGNNTFSGGLGASAGTTIAIGHNNAMGSATATFYNTTTLRIDANMTGVNAIANNIAIETTAGDATMTIDTDGADSFGYNGEISGIISEIGGNTGHLTKTGWGILKLSNNNTFTGNVTVNEGTLDIGVLGALDNAVTILLNNNTTLSSSTDISNAMTLAGDVYFDIGATADFSGIISGTTDLSKLGIGTLTLSKNNTFAINSQLRLFNGSNLILSGNNIIGNGAGGAGITVDDGVMTLSGNNTFGTNTRLLVTAVSPALGELILSSSNTFGVGSTIDVIGGILGIGNNTAMGNNLVPDFLGGATLRTDAALNVANDINLWDNMYFDTNSFNSNFSGVFAGTGNLTFIGDILNTDVLTLSNNSTYFGNTIISNGTVRLGVNDGLPIDTGLTVDSGAAFDMNGFNQIVSSINGFGEIKTGGVLSVTGAANSTFDGLLSGVGSLVVNHFSGVGSLVVNHSNPAAILHLTGPNTYSGGTTVNAGTVAISNDTALGTGSLTLNGANAGLRFDADLIIGTAIVVGAGGGTINTFGFNSTLSGSISGVNALAITGSGLGEVLALTGGSNHSGSLTISNTNVRVYASTLSNITVNSGATLSGSGTVGGNIINSGVVAPGSGAGTYETLTVGGDCSGTGIIDINLRASAVPIAGTDNSSIKLTKVGANANMAGGTIRINPSAQSFKNVGTYTILETSGGGGATVSNTGTLTIISSLAGLALIPDYTDSTKIRLNASMATVSENTLASLPPAIKEIVTVLNDINDKPGSIAGTVIDAINVISTDISPVKTITAISILAIDLIEQVVQNQALNRQPSLRTVGLRQSSFADQSFGDTLSFKSANSITPAIWANPNSDTFYAKSSGEAQENFEKQMAGQITDRPFNIWFAPFGYITSQKEHNLKGMKAATITARAFGSTIGFDYRTKNNIIGTSVGYTRTSTDASDKTSESILNHVKWTVYGSLYNKLAFIDGSIGFGASRYESQRHVIIPTLPQITARSAHWAYTVTPSIAFGLTWRPNGSVIISPYLDLSYATRIEQDYQEEGAGQLNMYIHKKRSAIFHSELGLRFTGHRKLEDGTKLSVSASTSYTLNTGSGSTSVKANFVGSDSLMKMKGEERTRSMTASISGELAFTTGMYISTTYHGDYGLQKINGNRAHTFSFKFGKRF